MGEEDKGSLFWIVVVFLGMVGGIGLDWMGSERSGCGRGCGCARTSVAAARFTEERWRIRRGGGSLGEWEKRRMGDGEGGKGVRRASR